jgi:hypothetical protein
VKGKKGLRLKAKGGNWRCELSVEKKKTTHNQEHEQLTTDNQQQTTNSQLTPAMPDSQLTQLRYFSGDRFA